MNTKTGKQVPTCCYLNDTSASVTSARWNGREENVISLRLCAQEIPDLDHIPCFMKTQLLPQNDL